MKQICALQNPVFLTRSLLWRCMSRSDLHLIALTNTLFSLSWVNKIKSIFIFVVCVSQLWSIIRSVAFYGICALHFHHSSVVRAFILVAYFSVVVSVLMCSLLHLSKTSLTLGSSVFWRMEEGSTYYIFRSCISRKINVSSPLHASGAEAECRVQKLVSIWPIAKYSSTCSLKHSPWENALYLIYEV